LQDGDQLLSPTGRVIERPLSAAGTALVAVLITKDSYKIASRELDSSSVANHPEIVKVLSDAVSWIRQSVGS